MNNSMNVGVINGGNNNFTQNNNFHQKNIYNNGGGNKPNGNDPASTAIAALLGVFAATVAIAVSYLHHRDVIFFWLQLGLIAGGMLHVLSLWPQYQDSTYLPLPQVGGMALVAVLAWLTFTTLDALPSEVLAIAAQAPASAGYLQQKLEVWQRFNHTGHRLILENLGSALFLAAGILLNLMLGVQQVFESAGRSYQHPLLAAVGHWLRLFKHWGFFAATLASLGAFMSIYGFFSAFGS